VSLLNAPLPGDREVVAVVRPFRVVNRAPPPVAPAPAPIVIDKFDSDEEDEALSDTASIIRENPDYDPDYNPSEDEEMEEDEGENVPPKPAEEQQIEVDQQEAEQHVPPTPEPQEPPPAPEEGEVRDRGVLRLLSATVRLRRLSDTTLREAGEAMEQPDTDQSREGGEMEDPQNPTTQEPETTQQAIQDGGTQEPVWHAPRAATFRLRRLSADTLRRYLQPGSSSLETPSATTLQDPAVSTTEILREEKELMDLDDDYTGYFSPQEDDDTPQSEEPNTGGVAILRQVVLKMEQSLRTTDNIPIQRTASPDPATQVVQTTRPQPLAAPRDETNTHSLPGTSTTTHIQFRPPSLHSLSLSPDDAEDTDIELDDDYNTYFPPTPTAVLEEQAIHSADPRPAVSPKPAPIIIPQPSTSNQNLNNPGHPPSPKISPSPRRTKKTHPSSWTTTTTRIFPRRHECHWNRRNSIGTVRPTSSWRQQRIRP
jgi:hypothetical protein